jgi:hypothetical protein
LCFRALVLAAADLLFAWAQSALASIVPAISVGENPGAITTSSTHDCNLFLKGWFSGSIRFDFNPLGTDTWLLVSKTLVWEGGGRPRGSIRVAEGVSTVPFPGAAWLLGAGLVGMAAMRRARSSKFKKKKCFIGWIG